VANKVHVIPLRGDELTRLIEQSAVDGFHVDVAFGTGGAAFKWEEGTPVPAALNYLMLLRGVSIENMEGAGI